MSHTDHRATSPTAVRCAVLTVSDTRTEQTDTAGAAIVTLLEGAGHTVVEKTIVRDEPEEIEVVPWKLDALHELMLREDFSEGRSIAALFIAREWLRHGGK